MIEQTLSFD